MARRQERCGAFSAIASGRRIFGRTPRASRARRGRVPRASSSCSTRGFRTPVRAKRRCRRSKESPSRAGRRCVSASTRCAGSSTPGARSNFPTARRQSRVCRLLSAPRPPIQRRGRRLLRAARASGGPHRERHRRHQRVSGGARARSRRAGQRSGDRRRETAEPHLRHLSDRSAAVRRRPGGAGRACRKSSVRRGSKTGRSTMPLNPRLRERIAAADLIIYAPGTQHSSLFPSYLTKDLSRAIASNLTAIKLLVTNIQPDAEISGSTAVDIIERAVYYLKEKGTLPLPVPTLITHYLINDPKILETDANAGYVPLGHLDTLEDPRLVRIGNYEDGVSGRHDASKVLTPFLQSFLSQRRRQRIAVWLLRRRVAQQAEPVGARDGARRHPGARASTSPSSTRPTPTSTMCSCSRCRSRCAISEAQPSRRARHSCGPSSRGSSTMPCCSSPPACIAAKSSSRDLAADERPARRGVGQPPPVAERHRGVVSASLHATRRCWDRSATSAAMCSASRICCCSAATSPTRCRACAPCALGFLTSLPVPPDDKLANQYLLSRCFGEKADVLEMPVQFLPLSPERVRRTTLARRPAVAGASSPGSASRGRSAGRAAPAIAAATRPI